MNKHFNSGFSDTRHVRLVRLMQDLIALTKDANIFHLFHCHWVYIRFMSRKALSYLLLVLIALQSVTAMADVHPVDYSDSAPFSSDFTDGSSSGILDSSIADPAEQNTAPDDLFHGHHHGCHCHVYLSGNLTHSNFLHKLSLHNDYHAIIPEAPSSSLYRPPIA